MGDHALICSGGRGGCLATWKTKRHNACRNILVRLGVAAGLTPGDDIDVEARYLHTQYRPSDIRATGPAPDSSCPVRFTTGTRYLSS